MHSYARIVLRIASGYGTLASMSLFDNPDIKHIYCSGIGGIGVSGLAELLLARGYVVSGSDVQQTQITERLARLGASIHYQQAETNVQGADAFVYSSAITPDNPEYLAAKQAGIPMIRRGELMADLFHQAIGIAVAGTHGKTTTSSMAAYALQALELDPSYIIGGIINGTNSPVHQGEGQLMVVEADESDATFLHLRPRYAIVTNIDADHLTTYNNDFAKLKEAFIDFINSVEPEGCAIVCMDDPVIQDILPYITARVVTYGFNEAADICAQDFCQQGVSTQVSVCYADGELFKGANIQLPGQHNLLNALAVAALAEQLAVQRQQVWQALNDFPGVGRRFYAHGSVKVGDGQALVFDDYGHHPQEIKATLQAARGAWPDRRIVMVFQPHRYTRTRDLLQEFACVLADSDVLVLTDIYSAGEKAIAGINGETLLNAITQCGKVVPNYVADTAQLPATLKAILKPNDIVLFQGAGSIGLLAAVFAEQCASTG